MIIPPRPSARRSKPSPTPPRKEPEAETRAQKTAAPFAEVVRLLTEHPELFDDHALDVVGVVGALCVTATRKAATGHTAFEIMRGVQDMLFKSMVKLTKAERRVAWPLLRRLRGAWIESEAARAARALLRERYEIADTSTPGKASIKSPCPHCGVRAIRDLVAPAPCQCGYRFAALEGV